MDKLVSVIIPTFNRGNLLLEAIGSILEQTYKNYEIIVVDDGSTEDIAGLLIKYSGIVRYMRIPHSGHPSVGRNAGIEIARGEYIAFLDNDDLWTPGKLEEQVDILNKNPDIGLVCANAYIVKNDEVLPDTSFVTRYSNLKGDKAISGNVWNHLLFDNYIVTSTVLIRRRLLDITGVFSTSMKQRITQDYDLWLRVTAITNIYYIPKFLAYYREDGGLHNTETTDTYWDSMLETFTNLRYYLKKLDIAEESIYLVDRRIYEFKSYMSLKNNDPVRSLDNLSHWFYYRLRSAITNA